MARVGDVMTREVVTAREDLGVADLARLLASAHISGVPVVDAEDRLCGVASLSDLAVVMARSEGEPVPLNLHMHRWWEEDGGEFTLEGVDPDLRVRDVMTPGCVCVEEDTPLGEAVGLLVDMRLHRLVVTDAALKVVGILTATDVLRAVRRLLEPAPAP